MPLVFTTLTGGSSKYDNSDSSWSKSWGKEQHSFFLKAEFTTCHDYLYMINIRIEVEKCDILSYKSKYFEVVMV